MVLSPKVVSYGMMQARFMAWCKTAVAQAWVPCLNWPPEVAAVLRMSAFTISAKAIAGTEACLRFR